MSADINPGVTLEEKGKKEKRRRRRRKRRRRRRRKKKKMKTKMDLYLPENLHMCTTNCRDAPAILYTFISNGKAAPLNKAFLFAFLDTGTVSWYDYLQISKNY